LTINVKILDDLSHCDCDWSRIRNVDNSVQIATVRRRCQADVEVSDSETLKTVET
jgi:hypothetical protein